MKAKLIAVSSLCATIATACLFFAGFPGVRWALLLLSVIASIAVVIPLLIGGELIYSILTFIVSAILGILLGFSNIVYIVPTITFFMPFAIIKAYGEKLKANFENVSADLNPFENDNNQESNIQQKPKRCIPTWLCWVLYYVLLEAGIFLTLFFAKILMPSFFDSVVSNNLFLVLLVVVQLLPIPYDILLRGCFVATNKILKKIKK